ncbi:MAG: PEP-utilizing enzyme, partial [Proteobacteria bacterium]|nr:PEP-utilizing enzyme [Pseudomonadota bacterium]
RFSFEHPEAQSAPADAHGREQRGQGDNVVKVPANVIGIARYYRSADQVMHSLTEGVPPDTIAIIDDSGGTLTAPILEQFKGVICAGGTVRSHLGILTREYGIPCLMGAKISGIFEGDTVELEVSGQSKTTEAYQTGVEMTVRVWKHAAKK